MSQESNIAEGADEFGLEDGRRREDIRGPMEARIERWICCNSRGMLLLSTRLRNVDFDK